MTMTMKMKMKMKMKRSLEEAIKARSVKMPIVAYSLRHGDSS
jgi:hypothetical protein